VPLVTTVAGNGAPGIVDGTGGPNGTAEFNSPEAVAADALGNIYVADPATSQLHKIDAQGNVTTFTPPSGLFLRFLTGVAVDTENVFFTESQTVARIWVAPLDGGGVILAGTGTPGFADGTGGPNGTAEFDDPRSVVLDRHGNVIVADTANNRIRLVQPQGDTSTLAGNGTPGFADGTGGPAGTAEFNNPEAVAVDEQGNVFVADSGNNRIRKIDSAGNVTTVAGNGTPGYVNGTGGPNGTAEFNDPGGIAVNSQGEIFVADPLNEVIRKIDALGNVTTFAGNGAPGFADGPASGAEFYYPAGLSIDAEGNILVADQMNNRIRKIAP
jgi:sugar lactone lactonase YvrE